jgi:hypothetical protein
LGVALALFTVPRTPKEAQSAYCNNVHEQTGLAVQLSAEDAPHPWFAAAYRDDTPKPVLDPILGP